MRPIEDEIDGITDGDLFPGETPSPTAPVTPVATKKNWGLFLTIALLIVALVAVITA